MARTSTSSTSIDGKRLSAPPFYHWLGKLADGPKSSVRPPVTYRELWGEVGELVRLHDAVKVRGIGASAGGEPLWAVTVGDGAPTVFVLAGLGAMEHVGTAAALALLRRAARGAGGWSRRRLVAIPVANPDGYRACERMLANGGRRFVRSNRRGVDLDRNFAVGWDDRDRATRLLRRLFEPGTAPLSEPESRAVDLVIAAERPAFAVSLRAFGETIGYPYASTAEEPADVERLRAVAAAMAARQPGRGYRVVQLGRRSRYLKTCGSEIDHMYGRYGALAFAVEIGAGPRLTAPSTWLRPYRWYTPPRRLLERDIERVMPALDYLAELDPRGTRE